MWYPEVNVKGLWNDFYPILTVRLGNRVVRVWRWRTRGRTWTKARHYGFVSIYPREQ